MEEMIEKIKDVIVQENDKLREELKETMNQENDKLREELVELMNQKNEELRQELKQDLKNLEKAILDRQFVFENEYGTKIDAIFDYVQFHQKNNLKRFDRIDEVEKKVEVIQIHDFDHEKRISNLERKRV